LSKEDKESIIENVFNKREEDVGLLDLLAEDVERNGAIIKSFLMADEKQGF